MYYFLTLKTGSNFPLTRQDCFIISFTLVSLSRTLIFSIFYYFCFSFRYTPLKEAWLKIFTPIVEHLLLQVRFNTKTRNVEIKVCPETKDVANLQKAADFVKVT